VAATDLKVNCGDGPELGVEGELEHPRFSG